MDCHGPAFLGRLLARIVTRMTGGLEHLASWPPCKPAQRKRQGRQALRSKTKVATVAASLATLPPLATFGFCWGPNHRRRLLAVSDPPDLRPPNKFPCPPRRSPA